MDPYRELLATMAVVAAGAMLGRLAIRGVRLDMAAMLLVGVLFAHFGVSLSPALGIFGLLLFLYTVGNQAGPALRAMHRQDLRLALGAVLAVWTLLGAVYLIGSWIGLPPGLRLGTLAGFFSSGASLALIQGRFGPDGTAAGFALAAPVCTLLVMILVQVWHALRSSAFDDELRRWNDQMSRASEPIVAARIRVRPPRPPQTLAECKLPCAVLWIRRGEETLAPHGDTVLLVDDLLRVGGTEADVREAGRLLGEVIPGPGRREVTAPIVRKFFVSNPGVIHQRLDRLALPARYGATITRIRRAGINLPARAGFRLSWGDRVQVSAPSDHMAAIERLFGDDAHGIERSAFPRAALVIFAGGLLGTLPVKLAGMTEFRLGPALGVLALSLLTSMLHRTGPIIWSQTMRASRLLAQIGLPLFLAQVGNASYGGLLDALLRHGIRLPLLCVAAVLLLVGLVGVLGRILGCGPLATLSLLPPVALNSAAFNQVQEAHRERLPGHVYGVVYPVVSIVLILTFLAISFVA